MYSLLTMFGIFLVLEAPYILILLWGIFLSQHEQLPKAISGHYPTVCVALTCYSEGDLISIAVESIIKQDYPGKIILLVIVDGGSKYNLATVEAGKNIKLKHPNANIVIIDKDNRYGRVHSNNMGMHYAHDHDCKYYLIMDGDTYASAGSISSFVNKMESDEKLSALSGNVKVRNLGHLVTKLTYMEYALGIVLSRFGLSRFGYVNNVSGAFGFFRVKDVLWVNGWRPNSAEDFDMVLRLYMHKYKIGHCNFATAYTDSPETFTTLCKQRWIWSGDLLFLINKYYQHLTPKRIGIKLWLFLWYNMLITICLPFCIVIYSVFLLNIYTIWQFLLIMAFIYILYLYSSLVLYLIYYKTLEEDKKMSQHVIFYILLFPLYAYLLKVNDMIAYCNEIFFKQHLFSKMAPKRVLFKAHLERNSKYIKF